MEKTIFLVIPARGGSKGVPQKNIMNLGGKPLIQHVFDAARQSKYVGKIILSTDDDKIAKIGKALGIEVPFIRPKELSTDDASLISVIKHAQQYFDDIGFRADGILSLQPTCPFLTAKTIDDAIELWLSSGCDSVTTISEITKGHPYISKKLNHDNAIEDYCLIPKDAVLGRRQIREKAYYLTGGLYLRSRILIEAQNSDAHYLGGSVKAVVVDELEAIDINSEFDFKVAEFVMNNVSPLN